MIKAHEKSMICNDINSYLRSLFDNKYRKSAIKVFLFVATVLFIINHGSTLWQDNMTLQRWILGI